MFPKNSSRKCPKRGLFSHSALGASGLCLTWGSVRSPDPVALAQQGGRVLTLALRLKTRESLRKQARGALSSSPAAPSSFPLGSTGWTRGEVLGRGGAAERPQVTPAGGAAPGARLLGWGGREPWGLGWRRWPRRLARSAAWPGGRGIGGAECGPALRSSVACGGSGRP